MKEVRRAHRILDPQLSAAPKSSPGSARCVAVGSAIAFLLLISAAAFGQSTSQLPAPPDASMSIPSGYSVHEAVDLGGRLNDVVGSGAMYDSMLNIHTGPRVVGETFQMHALPGAKNTPLDDLTAFGSGFGGDPFSIARLAFSKSKYYEFSAVFRRDRKYFDYDLLGNPNIPSGQTMPIGPSNAPSGSFAWPQVTQSPFLFNTVRRMTDTNLTVMPLSTLTFRLAYSKNVMEGPSYSPSGYQLAGAYSMVIGEYQRNSTDDFTGSLDWKPVQGTKFTYEQQFTHYKGDSYFTMGPNYLNVQESDGTTVSLLTNYYNLAPYGISSCNTGSMGSAYTAGPPASYTIFSPPTTGSLPVINPACAVMSSYLRTAPTRVMFPTEVLRMQSATLKSISMDGNVRFTNAHMNLPSYNDIFQGLAGTSRSIAYQGNATARREVLSADYGIVWQTSDAFSLAEQISFSTWHQPGTTEFTSGTTLATAGNPNETIYSSPLTTKTAAPGAATFEGSSNIGVPAYGFMGQLYVTNNLTASWDVSPRTTFSFTWRYQDHDIAEGNPHHLPLPVGAVTGGTITIHENAGILTAAVRPFANWDVTGSIEVSYADNAATAVSPRQLRHYRVHSIYRPRPWATISGAYNDLERHNNTNNNASAVTAGDDPYEGPLNHVDYSRIASVSAALYPNEHYGFDLSYIYSDVYSATNECFDNGDQNSSAAPATLPGAATLTSSGTPNVCPGVFTRGSTTQLADWFGRDFSSAPTQFASAAITVVPGDKVRYGIGYRISSVNGNQFFNDARMVNGSLASSYQSPYANVAYKLRRDLTLKAEYNFYGYGEGGPSGPKYCSFSTSLTSSVVPCTSLTAPIDQTGLTLSHAGETAPRSFHANNILLGVHYEF
jgi:hypothetical protein